MLSARSLLFPTGSSPSNPPEKPSGSPIHEISDSGPVKGANCHYCGPAQTPPYTEPTTMVVSADPGLVMQLDPGGET